MRLYFLVIRWFERNGTWSGFCCDPRRFVWKSERYGFGYLPKQWFPFNDSLKWIPSRETMIDKITHKMQRHFYGHFFSGRWIILIFKRNLSPWIHFICVLHALGWWMVINVHELHSVHEHHFFLHSFFSRISQVK